MIRVCDSFCINFYISFICKWWLNLFNCFIIFNQGETISLLLVSEEKQSINAVENHEDSVQIKSLKEEISVIWIPKIDEFENEDQIVVDEEDIINQDEHSFNNMTSDNNKPSLSIETDKKKERIIAINDTPFDTQSPKSNERRRSATFDSGDKQRIPIVVDLNRKSDINQPKKQQRFSTVDESSEPSTIPIRHHEEVKITKVPVKFEIIPKSEIKKTNTINFSNSWRQRNMLISHEQDDFNKVHVISSNTQK